MQSVTAKLSDLSAASKAVDAFEDDDDDEFDEEIPIDLSDYTEEEIGCQNKSVKILPGVARLISQLPKDRFAVATSGAKTYCHGGLLRAGIVRLPLSCQERS